MAYLIERERSDSEEKDYETFKQRMIAAHPEWMQEIIDDFEKAKNGEYAVPLSDEEIQTAPVMDGNSLEEALEQMKALGIGMEG